MTQPYNTGRMWTRLLQGKGDPGVNVRRILGSATATALIAIGSVVGAPGAQAAHVTCGTVFGPAFAGQTVTLDSNVGPCSNTQVGILIEQANGFTLDLNGFSVIGDGSIAEPFLNQVGINIFNSSNVTIKNGTVTKWNNGIYLDGSGPDGGSNNTVTRVRAVDNIGPDQTGIFGEGIQIFQGGGHTITENVIVHNGPYSGINAYQSSNNTISRNQVADNNILDADGHHGGSTIMQDIGIWVINLQPNPALAMNNTVRENSVARNGLDGIQVARFTNNNFVRNNSVANNGFGQPPGNGFRDGDGIANFGSFNTIETNSVQGNGGSGIKVYRSVNSQGVPVGGQSNTIRSNSAFNNGSAPNSVSFDLFDTNLTPPCDANTWASNQFGTKNQACIN